MNERHKNICFFFSLSPEEMERFDDKNSLNGGFFAISGGIYIYIYIEVLEERKKSGGELFMLQAQSWFTVVQRH